MLRLVPRQTHPIPDSEMDGDIRECSGSWPLACIVQPL